MSDRKTAACFRCGGTLITTLRCIDCDFEILKNRLTVPPSLNDLAKMVNDLATEKGWYDEPKTEDEFIESACNNLHNEVSELHEAWRNNMLHAPCDKAGAMRENGIEPLSCLEEELADIIIRALDDAAHLGIDIHSAVMRKHAYNATRPRRHGGKRS